MPPPLSPHRCNFQVTANLFSLWHSQVCPMCSLQPMAAETKTPPFYSPTPTSLVWLGPRPPPPINSPQASCCVRACARVYGFMMSAQASVGTTFLLQHRQQIDHHHPLQPSTTSRWNRSNIWSMAAFFYYKTIYLLVIISCVYLWLYCACLPQPEIPALCSGAFPLCPHTFLCPDNNSAGLQRERQLNKAQLSKTRERHTSTFRCDWVGG